MAELAKKIRAKYPGHYDDMSDDDLETAVLSKHPEYKDLTTTPVEEKEIQLKSEQYTEEPAKKKTEPKQEEGIISRGWRKLTEPLTEAPTRFAEQISQYINPERTISGLKGIGSAFIEGLGHTISGLTSPLNIGTAGLATGETLAAKAGLPIIAEALGLGSKAVGAGMAGHGVSQIYSGEDIPTKLMGGLELAGGLSGMRSRVPSIGRSVTEETPIISRESPATENIRRNAPYGEGGIMPSEALPTELKGPEVSSEDYPVIHFKEDVIPSPSPDLAPVGGEVGYNSQFPEQVMQARGLSNEELFNMARNKFNMGRELPEAPAKAEYAFDWPEAGGPQFNIIGGPSHGSTVGLAKLKTMGIEIPEIPEKPVRMSGDQLREQFLKNRVESRPAREEFNPESLQGLEKTTEREPLLAGEKGELNIPGTEGEPKKPRYRLDTETGMGIPIDEQGNQIGPAVGPKGEQLRPDIAALSKYNDAAKMASESQKKSLYHELRDANRTILTAFDFSAPGRQGAPLMLNKEYWTSFDDMFKSWGSQKAYEMVRDSIESHPNFTRPVFSGKELPSLAERAGLKWQGGEEFYNSKLAEKLPFVMRSERAYNGFLGKLRADTFNRMVSDAEDLGLNPKQNDVLLKKYASFINDATGRGSLGKLEKAAPLLNEVFFDSRLMASRVNMYKRVLNPMTYVNEDPIVRKQTLKSLIALVGVGTSVGQLAKLGGAQVSHDSNSSDFGKIKIGDTRIDPFAGFQQYAVGASRLLTGETTSSITGKKFDLTSGKFGMPTRASIVSNFMTNKLAPIPSFVWSWLNNKEFDGTPFNAKQAIANRTIPIVMQDLYDIYQEDPRKFPPGIFKQNPTATKVGMSTLPIFGEGIQTYGR